jgi:hypothetical protein
MLGVLVHGNNHFIVRGPLPSPEAAQALVRRWSWIQIGSGIDATREGGRWRVSTREFREDLTWAVVVSDGSAPQPAIAMLLEELSSRGVKIHRLPGEGWTGAGFP